MITIDFYNYTGKTYTVNKKLNDPVSIGGLFRERVNILSPVITIKYNGIFNYNYCYIRELNRYYFVGGVTILDTNTFSVELTIDVLKTYETEILGATATITESDNADRYISNRQSIVDVRPNFQRIEYDKNLFNTNGTIIMVTLKGNK